MQKHLSLHDHAVHPAQPYKAREALFLSSGRTHANVQPNARDWIWGEWQSAGAQGPLKHVLGFSSQGDDFHQFGGLSGR